MRDTIDIAREAGFDITCDPTETPWRTFVEGWEEELKAFEALIRDDERKQAEERIINLFVDIENPYLPDIAAAIRARVTNDL
jgi:hypothetical protein